MTILIYQGRVARVELDVEDNVFFGLLVGINDVVGFYASDEVDLKTVDDTFATWSKLSTSR